MKRYRSINMLTQEFPAILQQVNAKSLTAFVIYPRAGKPVGTSIVLALPAPLIDGFFEAIKDARSYVRSGLTIASLEHNWFIEIMMGEKRLQIRCCIPSNERNRVVVGEFLGSKGAFQSHQLYHWYQKYSHRWLEPEEEHDTNEEQQEGMGNEE